MIKCLNAGDLRLDGSFHVPLWRSIWKWLGGASKIWRNGCPMISKGEAG
jgi:hypothetical protein